MLARINEVVVKHGRACFKKNVAEKLEIKTDSYVLETNVHYPTDMNLLWDAGRKSIELTSRLCERLGLRGWRKAANWKRELKKSKRDCEKTAFGGGAHKAERMKAAASWPEAPVR